MKKWYLQLILDKTLLKKRDLVKIAESAIEGGARFIQLRDKISSDSTFFEEAKRLKNLTERNACVLIINDRVDIAMALEAGGVHLGREDLPYKDARLLLGNNKIIGISTHKIEEARLAEEAGADYIGVGPIFETETKPGLRAMGPGIVSEISKEIQIPAFFIGGINLINVDEIIRRGGRAFAVASAILASGDIRKTTESFLNRLRGIPAAVTR